MTFLAPNGGHNLFAVSGGTEDVLVFVFDEIGQLFPSRTKILARVELGWVLRKRLSYRTGHGQAVVRVDIDLPHA